MFETKSIRYFVDKQMRSVLVAILLFFTTLNGTAQAWKSVRNEFSFGVGASNFLGDLGGSKGIGTHGIKDLKFQMTRPTLSGVIICGRTK